MKTLILLATLTVSSMALAGPAESVADTVNRLIQVMQTGNPAARAASMCQLVRNRVDVASIGSDLVGRQFAAADASGTQKFLSLVPSIIVTEFFERLSGIENQPANVDPTLLPKGSSRVGVRTQVGAKSFIVTINKTNLRVYDVEWNNISLIGNKRAELQRAFTGYQLKGNTPVTDLVNDLLNSGNLVRCN